MSARVMSRRFSSRRTCAPLRPILRCVSNAEHLYLAFDDFVNDNIGPRRKHQLRGMFRPADAPSVGQRFKQRYAFVNCLRHAMRGSRIVRTDPFDYLGEVIGCCSSPANRYQERNSRSMRSTTSS